MKLNERHLMQLAAVLDAGGLWISGSDLEAMWLGSILPDGHPTLLAPSMAAIRSGRSAAALEVKPSRQNS